MVHERPAMTDFIDQACEAEGIFLEEALARFRQNATVGSPCGKTVRESALHCQDCGMEIPEARRLAVRGCIRCVDCQEESEKHGYENLYQH